MIRNDGICFSARIEVLFIRSMTTDPVEGTTDCLHLTHSKLQVIEN